MKIALKYGLLITFVVAGWILIVRVILNQDGASRLSLLAPLVFNLTAFVSIYFGIREKKRMEAGRFTFKQGLKTGVAISFVAAVTACLFFLIQFLIAGPKLLISEPGSQLRPLWQVALMAYAGLFFGLLVFGVIYSTLSAFVLARQRQS